MTLEFQRLPQLYFDIYANSDNDTHGFGSDGDYPDPDPSPEKKNPGYNLRIKPRIQSRPLKLTRMPNDQNYQHISSGLYHRKKNGLY